MSSQTPPNPQAPTVPTERTDDASPAAHGHDSRSRRTRQITAIVLIVIGLALLVVTLRAQSLGLAPTAGASWTQVTTGMIGTVLTVVGLAMIVQAFAPDDEPSMRQPPRP